MFHYLAVGVSTVTKGDVGKGGIPRKLMVHTFCCTPTLQNLL